MSARSLVVAASAILALAACASKPPTAATSPGAGGEAPSVRADDSPFGETGRPVPLALQQEFAQTAGDRVYFGFDSHDLSPEARETLTRQAYWLSLHAQVRVLVAGNCDERGTRQYNFALGSRRAAAARGFLIEHGVAADRIRTVSYGRERPLDPTSNEGAWARNRNAQTILIDLGPA